MPQRVLATEILILLLDKPRTRQQLSAQLGTKLSVVDRALNRLAAAGAITSKMEHPDRPSSMNNRRIYSTAAKEG